MRRRATIAVFALSPLLAGCPWLRSPVAPIPTVSHEPAAPEEARGLVVLLPGIFDAPEDYEAEGVVAALEAVAPGFNAIMVDAHVGYYQGEDNNVVERLRDDVVLPAKGRGYASIWLAGVSLGGFGSILYASQYPEHVDGVVAIAPFLGTDDVVKPLTEEIRTAGGLTPWEPGDLSRFEQKEAFFRGVWHWLDGYGSGAPRPPLFLGYGGEDDFAPTNALVGEVLPPSRVWVVPDGDHDWGTWTPILTELFRRALGGETASALRSSMPRRRLASHGWGGSR